MFGHNLKVHLAGAEQVMYYECQMLAGCRYHLFTVFPFICEKFGIKSMNIFGCKDKSLAVKIIGENILREKHTIMDSGLFTLMFGACAGKRDRAFIDRWADELANFVNSNNIRATCVEVDCQKVLGVDEAWQVRHRLKEMLPNNRIINVFHIEDGKRGLDRLIEYSDYIAISVPEMRVVYGSGKAYENATVRLANYIKSKKPGIDIHLLGCTALKLLRELRFCTSSDSTTWQEILRYGYVKINGKMYRATKEKEEMRAPFEAELRRICEKKGLNVNCAAGYYAKAIAAMKCLLLQYAQFAGDQS